MCDNPPGYIIERNEDCSIVGCYENEVEAIKNERPLANMGEGPLD